MSRDWNKDMKIFESAFRGEQINTTMFVRHGREAGIYWLQQYDEEKERADKAEKALAKQTEGLKIAIERMDKAIEDRKKFNEVYKLLLNNFKAAEAREKKLREAIEEEVKCHILLGTYKRADELRKLLASLYPKEEEAN